MQLPLLLDLPLVLFLLFLLDVVELLGQPFRDPLFNDGSRVEDLALFGRIERRGAVVAQRDLFDRHWRRLASA